MPSSRPRLWFRHRLQLPGDRVGQGQDLDEAAGIKNTDIAEELALPPVKIHCSILAEDAIKAAIADYKQKVFKVRRAVAITMTDAAAAGFPPSRDQPGQGHRPAPRRQDDRLFWPCLCARVRG